MTTRDLSRGGQRLLQGLAAIADRVVAALTSRRDPEAHAWRFGLAAFLLAMLGVVVQASVASPVSEEPWARPLRQGIFLVVGAMLAWSTRAVGHHRAAALSRYALWAVWGPLLWLAVSERGRLAARWIELPGFSVQPPEIAKLVLVVFFARFVVQRGQDISDFRRGFLPAAAYLGVTALLVAAAPDFGQTAFIVATSSAVLIVGGMRFRQVLPVLVVGVPLILVFMSQRWSYIGDRISSFLDGGADQVKMGISFLERGGMTGVGLGEGRAHVYVPEIHNDFALIAVGEQWGVIGSLGVVALFLTLVWHGFAIAFSARDTLGFLIAFGVSLLLGLQAAVNLAVVTGSVPPKGMALPFVSYGGSSMVVCAVAVGLVLAVARDASRTTESAESNTEEPRSLTARS